MSEFKSNTPDITSPGFLAGLFKCYGNEFAALYHDKLSGVERQLRADGKWVGMKLNEAASLYMMVRHMKPMFMVECGVGHGWSSTWILHALRRNGEGVLFSFDILHDAIEHARKITGEFSDIVTFTEGDATPSLSCAFGMMGGMQDYDAMPEERKDTLGKMLRQMKPMLGSRFVDMLFMDGYHNYEFGHWWTTQVVPYVAKGGVVAVHDIVDINATRDPAKMDEYIAVNELVKAGGVKVLQSTQSIDEIGKVFPLAGDNTIGVIYLQV